MLRRHFLKRAGGATAAILPGVTGGAGLLGSKSAEAKSAVPLRTPPSAPPSGGSPKLENLTRESFAAHRDSRFNFMHGQFGRVETTLAEVAEGKTYPREKAVGRVSFSLLFQGPVGKPLTQQVYPVEHEKLGRFDLFIVPMGRNEKTITYEAIFNRFHPKGSKHGA